MGASRLVSGQAPRIYKNMHKESQDNACTFEDLQASPQDAVRG